MARAQDCYHVKKLAVRFYSMKHNRVGSSCWDLGREEWSSPTRQSTLNKVNIPAVGGQRFSRTRAMV